MDHSSQKSATMKNSLYNTAAVGQLSSHEITKPALKQSIARILHSFEQTKVSFFFKSNLSSAVLELNINLFLRSFCLFEKYNVFCICPIIFEGKTY